MRTNKHWWLCWGVRNEFKTDPPMQGRQLLTKKCAYCGEVINEEQAPERTEECPKFTEVPPCNQPAGHPKDCYCDMLLPAGATCSDCAHFKRCDAFGFTTGADSIQCDFAPSRFVHAAEVQ